MSGSGLALGRVRAREVTCEKKVVLPKLSTLSARSPLRQLPVIIPPSPRTTTYHTPNLFLEFSITREPPSDLTRPWSCERC